jgi:hypothetical protein
VHIKNSRLPLRRHLQSKFAAQPPSAFLPCLNDGGPLPRQENEKEKEKYIKKVQRKHSFSKSSIIRVWFLLETVNGLGGRLRCLVLVLHGTTH